MSAPRSRPQPGSAPVTRRSAILTLSVLGAATLTGCSGLPRSGAVHRSDAVAVDESGLVQTAPGPASGATPEQIVQGFLRAGEAGFSDDFVTAREFLIGPVREAWTPLGRVTVYRGSGGRTVSTAQDGTVEVTVDTMASLDADGVLTQADGSAVRARYSLATDASREWRIVRLPGGLLVPDTALSDNFAPRSLYFLARDLRRLVPDLRWLPRRTGERRLVSALLAGPAPWLAPAVTSAVPKGLELADDGVVTSDGTARVTLSQEATALDATHRSLLIAQIRATLTQVDGLDSVTVTSAGGDLGEAAALPDPARSPGALVGMSGGAVVRGASSTRTTLVTADTLGTTEARWPALGADGAVYALSGASLLRVGAGATVATAVLSAETEDPSKIVMLPPVVDRHGWVWTAIDGALTVVNAQGLRARIDADWLTDDIELVDLSAESERLAVRTRSGSSTSLRVAAVLRRADGVPIGLGDPVVLRPGSGVRAALAWYDPTSLCLLADPADGDGAPVLRRLQAPGTLSSSPGAQGATTLVANRADGSVLLTDSSQQVWQRVGATWRVISTDVTDVSYPLI